MSKKNSKKYSIRDFLKTVRRWIVSAVLVLWIFYVFLSTCITVFNVTDDTEYRWMLQNMNSGDYAEIVDDYNMNIYVGYFTKDEYPQFEEFRRFYNDYILSVEYLGAKEPEKYKKQLDESIANMEKIYENTIYDENIPHYEYLLYSVKE